MGSRRTQILIVALVVAAIAAVATFSYLRSADERAAHGQTLVSVYVVKKPITKGLPAEQAISDRYLQKDTIPAKVKPTTSVANLATIRGKVALTTLSQNQVLVDGMFVDPKVEQITNSQRLNKGRVAVTVSVDQVHGVAGLLVPGDKVDVLVKGADNQERMLYQNVEVLFIGGQAAPQPGETQAVTNPGSGLITFSVPPAAAAKLVYASTKQDSALYLALVPPDNSPIDVPPVSDANLFDSGSAATPYGP